VAGVDLSHEAAVGKIAEEEVEYLMGPRPDQDGSYRRYREGFPPRGY
jgi:hypothetical protein